MSKFALLSLFALTVSTYAAPVRVAAGMHVTTINDVGASVILRSVDSSGKYGPAFCTMATNGSTCVATQDFIASVADGSGRYDAGDAFSAWWGDDSYKTAQSTLHLKQGKAPTYIEYVIEKDLEMIAAMHVTTINTVGASVILRSVDSSGKYGPAFCTMATNGSTCVATQDFIASVADGSGRYDAGDAFSAWWGDDSYKTAQSTLHLKQGKAPTYIEYVIEKDLEMIAAMHVTTINTVGASVILRSVDSSGKYGPAFCTMATNGSTCVATQDFIASVADGSGRYDAGDAFSAWWGDDSYKTAQSTLILKQGKAPTYIEYDVKK